MKLALAWLANVKSRVEKSFKVLLLVFKDFNITLLLDLDSDWELIL